MSLILIQECNICGRREERRTESNPLERVNTTRVPELILFGEVFEDVCKRCADGLKQTVVALRGKPPTVPDEWTGKT